MTDVFVDVKNKPINEEPAEGTQSPNLASLAIGEGSKVFRGDQSGIWLGAEKFADARFKVDMTGALTATSVTITGYVEDVGGTYVSTETAAAAKIQLLPDANTGIVAYESDGTTKVFEVVVGGTNVGDVSLGDYAGGNGVLWDASAGDLIIKGDMTAGTIDGVAITGGTITGTTIKTAASGVRVELTASDAKIELYDAGNSVAGLIDDTGSRFIFEGKDGRDVEIIAAGGDIYMADIVHVDTIDENGAGYVDVNDDLNVGGWLATDSWVSLGGDLDLNQNDINDVDTLNADTKNFLIPHPDGSNRLLKYTAVESPEVAVSCRGVSTIGSDGTVSVVASDHFTAVTEATGLVTVDITPVGKEIIGLSELPTNGGFTVEGKKDTQFMWRITAVRKGFLDNVVEIDLDNPQSDWEVDYVEKLEARKASKALREAQVKEKAKNLQ